MWYNTPHWKIIALICCARRSPKVTLITVFVNIVAWKQARWPPLFITFLISPCLITSTYQVSSEIYGGIFYQGITLSCCCFCCFKTLLNLTCNPLSCVLHQVNSGQRKYTHVYTELSHTWQEAGVAPHASFFSHWFGRHLCVSGFVAYFGMWASKRFNLQWGEWEACPSHRTFLWHKRHLYFFACAWICSYGCFIYFILRL